MDLWLTSLLLLLSLNGRFGHPTVNRKLCELEVNRSGELLWHSAEISKLLLAPCVCQEIKATPRIGVPWVIVEKSRLTFWMLDMESAFTCKSFAPEITTNTNFRRAFSIKIASTNMESVPSIIPASFYESIPAVIMDIESHIFGTPTASGTEVAQRISGCKSDKFTYAVLLPPLKDCCIESSEESMEKDMLIQGARVSDGPSMQVLTRDKSNASDEELVS
ncbi:hypothetical protein N7494_005456 [Penicillium frequentans]|uniref:Uncharacterized protein n=1 Tax=Penicillium frequentans TaxID=3151616 RepID=A0AAD6CY87_9EURO|nr:hypothetical protein N7494_005456 [Penicillium glabrum]